MSYMGENYSLALFNGVLHVKTIASARPEKVIYNDPATVVIWDDGSKTVVRCHPDDAYDRERGFLLCCAKKLMGNGGSFNDEMRRHVWDAS